MLDCLLGISKQKSFIKDVQSYLIYISVCGCSKYPVFTYSPFRKSKYHFTDVQKCRSTVFHSKQELESFWRCLGWYWTFLNPRNRGYRHSIFTDVLYGSCFCYIGDIQSFFGVAFRKTSISGFFFSSYCNILGFSCASLGCFGAHFEILRSPKESQVGRLLGYQVKQISLNLGFF